MVAAEKKRLTDNLASRAKPRSKLYEITDVGEPGLRLRVSPHGTKTFTLRYRFDGKPRRDVLGRFGEINIEEARDRARAIKRNARYGVDLRVVKAEELAEAKRNEAEAKPFSFYAEKFLEENPIKSAAARRNLFETHILPPVIDSGIGDVQLAMLQRKQVKMFLTEKMKEPRRRGAKGKDGKPIPLGAQVNRIQAAIKSVTAWAFDEEYIDIDPLAGMKRMYGDRKGRTRTEAPRSRIFSDAEIKSLWEAADTLGYPRSDAIKMLFLTGCRKNEICAMEWSEVDLKQNLITIKAKRMKNKRIHTVPITDYMKAILEEIKNYGFAGKCVFSTTKGRVPYRGWSKAKIQFDKLTAFTDSWVYHDIRRTVRTGLPSIGIPHDISERVVSHTPSKLDQVYDHHDYLSQKRNALEAWGIHLMAIIEDRKIGENVERLADRRV